MINELGLKWNELLVYAVINSFTNNTKDHYFNWSLSYLSERTHQTTRNVQRCLKSLLDKWLITKDEKYDNWIKFVRYQTGYGQNVQGIDNLSWGYGQNVQGGIDKMSNNIQDIYTSDINNLSNDKLDNEVVQYGDEGINNLCSKISEVYKKHWLTIDTSIRKYAGQRVRNWEWIRYSIKRLNRSKEEIKEANDRKSNKTCKEQVRKNVSMRYWNANYKH